MTNRPNLTEEEKEHYNKVAMNMINKSKTPRTDKAEPKIQFIKGGWVRADFARELERELNDLKKELDTIGSNNMNDKDFTDAIDYTTHLSNTGRIVHRATIEFHTEYCQDPNESQLKEYIEEIIRDKMATDLHRQIYENRKEALAKAIDKLLSCVEPFFLPSEKLLEARDEVLKAAGFKAGNRLL